MHESTNAYLIRRAYFHSKCQIIKGTMQKARAAAMINSTLYDQLSLDALSEEEKAHLLPGETALEFAKHTYSAGQALIYGANSRFGNTPAFYEKMFDHNMPESFTIYHEYANYTGDFDQVIEQVLKEKPELKTPEGVEEYLYKQCLTTIAEYSSIAADESESPMSRSHAEAMVEKAQADINRISVYRKLVKKDYEIAGVGKVCTEAMFRMFTSSEQERGIRDMDPDKYREMLDNLAAGAFLTTESSDAEVLEAKEKNIAGLRTYYDAIKVHYNYLEDKYGYKTLNAAYCMAHKAEIDRDFANIQVDNNLVTHDAGVLDMKDPEDVRLKHLVVFYNTYGGVVVNYATAPINFGGTFTQEVYDSTYEDFYHATDASLAYLIEHPKSKAVGE